MEKQEQKKLSAVDIIDSKVFAARVEGQINQIIKQRNEISKNGKLKLKADAIGVMIREGRFNVEYLVNAYVKVLLKDGNYSRRDRDVINAIGITAYMEAEKVLNDKKLLSDEN